MTNYNRGEIILVDIPFSGAVGRKRRPAVIISTEEFNSAGIKLIVAAVTGNVSPPFRPGDTLLTDWSQAGLLKASAVRGVLATVDKSEIARVLGVVTANDLSNIQQNLTKVLGFPEVASENQRDEG